MAERRQPIAPFSFAGIERGFARQEARGVREEEKALEAQREEQRRQERAAQLGIQGAQLVQGQQQIDLQRERLAAGIQQQQVQQQFKERQAALEVEHRESQARISNALAVGGVLLKTPGATRSTKQKIMQTLSQELSDIPGWTELDFDLIDVDKAVEQVNAVWKNLNDKKITKAQAEIALQMVAAEHGESMEAQRAAGAISGIARAEEVTARTKLAATQRDNTISENIKLLSAVDGLGDPLLDDAQKKVLIDEILKLKGVGAEPAEELGPPAPAGTPAPTGTPTAGIITPIPKPEPKPLPGEQPTIVAEGVVKPEVPTIKKIREDAKSKLGVEITRKAAKELQLEIIRNQPSEPFKPLDRVPDRKEFGERIKTDPRNAGRKIKEKDIDVEYAKFLQKQLLQAGGRAPEIRTPQQNTTPPEPNNS